MMSGAEFQCAREFLGLSAVWAAERLGVDRRSLYRWERSVHPVPDDVEAAVLTWLEMTQRAVGVTAVEVRNRPSVPLAVSRTVDRDWPAGWYRMVASRAAEITGAHIEWER